MRRTTIIYKHEIPTKPKGGYIIAYFSSGAKMFEGTYKNGMKNGIENVMMKAVRFALSKATS
ncbi:MAG: hypothetical protein IPL35_12675 [Sphingobacteriales bacterium]|nr:hypothetical protein [Sphingobacteriales bacterium]